MSPAETPPTRTTLKFVTLGFGGPEGQAKRRIHRRAHIESIERWNSRGRVLLAGPLTDHVGSLSVIEAQSRDEAEEFVREDPFMSRFTTFL
jgi:uncharacterized protein YciI